MMEPKETIATRIPVSLAKRMRDATVNSREPFAPSVTQVVTHGIELALEKLKPRKSKAEIIAEMREDRDQWHLKKQQQ